MIDLGLARVSRLIQQTPQTWRAIHVAGTNGKGSICAYLSAMLHASGKSVARFTSPHLVDRWDCITINEQPVSETVFRDTERVVLRRNEEGGVQATEFELLTATAFELLNQAKVDFGVIEVGLGGRLDATNVLKQKAVTVITKIGLDHQSFLGNSLEEIALQKAGIMRKGVKCVVDNSNPPSVLRVIQQHAEELGADVVFPKATPSLLSLLSEQGFEPHQARNLACAHTAFRLACPNQETSLEHLLPVIKQVQWPGRLQLIDVSKMTGRTEPVLLDGAHNVQSAEVLATYVNKHFRSGGGPVTWVLAASEGKDLGGILTLLLQPGDRVGAVRFGPVDGMPWVRAADPKGILDLVVQHGIDATNIYNDTGELKSVLDQATATAAGGPIVIAGSLYLVSDTLRLLRQAT